MATTRKATMGDVIKAAKAANIISARLALTLCGLIGQMSLEAASDPTALFAGLQKDRGLYRVALRLVLHARTGDTFQGLSKIPEPARSLTGAR